MKTNILRHVAATMTIVTLATSLAVGCAAPPADEAEASGGGAVTVDEVKPAEADLVIADVAATHPAELGATKWTLYQVKASKKRLQKEAKGALEGAAAEAFDGFIAFGTDADDQVVWTVVVDSKQEKPLGVTRLDRAGRSIPFSVTAALGAQLADELRGLLVGNLRASAADSYRTALVMFGISGAGVPVVGYLAFGLAGATAGVGLVLCVAAVIAYRRYSESAGD